MPILHSLFALGHTRCCEETVTQTTHMQKSFVQPARHVSVIFGANSPLRSHQNAHFLLEDIKNKVFISSSHIFVL